MAIVKAFIFARIFHPRDIGVLKPPHFDPHWDEQLEDLQGREPGSIKAYCNILRITRCVFGFATISRMRGCTLFQCKC